MKEKTDFQTYRITFQGNLDESWQHWFTNFSFSTAIAPRGHILTTLTGSIIDQAALRGILTKLWDLNLIIVAVIQVDSNLLPE